jgi:YcxB-like protein
MNISISFKTEPEEFYEVARLYRNLAYAKQRSELLKTVVMLAVFVILIAVDVSPSTRSFFGGVIVTYLGVGLWGYWNYPKRVMQIWQPNTNLWSKHSVQLTDDGVEVNADKVRGLYRWNAFAGWRETANFFVLLTPDMGVVALPKRSFDSASSAEFRSFLESLRYGNLS